MVRNTVPSLCAGLLARHPRLVSTPASSPPHASAEDAFPSRSRLARCHARSPCERSPHQPRAATRARPKRPAPRAARGRAFSPSPHDEINQALNWPELPRKARIVQEPPALPRPRRGRARGSYKYRHCRALPLRKLARSPFHSAFGGRFGSRQTALS